MKIQFGMFADRFSKQLNARKIAYKPDQLSAVQEDADALTRLFCRRMVTTAVYDKIAKKIMTKLSDALLSRVAKRDITTKIEDLIK
jgi:hypothetical protein